MAHATQLYRLARRQCFIILDPEFQHTKYVPEQTFDIIFEELGPIIVLFRSADEILSRGTHKFSRSNISKYPCWPSEHIYSQCRQSALRNYFKYFNTQAVKVYCYTFPALLRKKEGCSLPSCFSLLTFGAGYSGKTSFKL